MRLTKNSRQSVLPAANSDPVSKSYSSARARAVGLDAISSPTPVLTLAPDYALCPILALVPQESRRLSKVSASPFVAYSLRLLSTSLYVNSSIVYLVSIGRSGRMRQLCPPSQHSFHLLYYFS